MRLRANPVSYGRSLAGRLAAVLLDRFSGRRARADVGSGERFEILAERSESTSEGWIERILHHRECAEVQMVLADETPASACLRHEDVEWLGLGVGQIVMLRRVPCEVAR